MQCSRYLLGGKFIQIYFCLNLFQWIFITLFDIPTLTHVSLHLNLRFTPRYIAYVMHENMYLKSVLTYLNKKTN